MKVEEATAERLGACLRCGYPTDKKLGESFVCDECYFARSSCCPEFGPEDISSKSCDNGEVGETKSKNKNM